MRQHPNGPRPHSVHGGASSGAPPGVGGQLRLVQLSMDTLKALLRGDLETASGLSGAALTPYFLEHAWLWEIRVAQAERDPRTMDWIARAALDGATVVGHVGFHGPPDDHGMIEVAYSVDPALRRRGYAKKMLAAALAWANDAPAVTVVRATVTPTNTASIATLASFPFRHVGEQWDDDDGLELIYELHRTPGRVVDDPATS